MNGSLAEVLLHMDSLDQYVADVPSGRYAKMEPQERVRFQDSIFKVQATRADSIFQIHGFPNYDLVGKKASTAFWLIIQHADHDVNLQQRVLRKMKVEVDKGKADSRKFALLTDRVEVNLGNAQIYGTQVAYNHDKCQAYPLTLVDSANVNSRRLSMQLEPLEVYLNKMSTMHFNMNKAYYKNKGIEEPLLYKQ